MGRIKRIVPCILFTLVPLAVACSSKSGVEDENALDESEPEKGPGGIVVAKADITGNDRTRKLSSLNAAEKGKLCDWLAGAIAGGYGRIRYYKCDEEESISAPKDQSACIKVFTSGFANDECRATVAQATDCYRRIWAAPCSTEISATAPSCKAVDPC